MLRRLRPARAADDGLTLSELLVSMLIVSMVLVVASTLTVSTLRQHNLTAAKTSSQADTRLALRQLSRDLRTAVPNQLDTATCTAPADTAAPCKSAFAFASANRITFYTSKGGATPVISRVTYEVRTGSRCLYRTEIKASGSTFPAANAKAHCVGAGAVTNTDLFAFSGLRPDFATDGPLVAVPPAGISLARATDANLASISSVRVRLTVAAEGRPEIAGTSVTQTVTLLNQTNALRS